MRTVAIAAVVAGQLVLCSHSVEAAELQPTWASAGSRVGSFAGARLRVPLGGGREKAQAGLALTSTLRSGAAGQLRFAKGAELGFSGEEAAIRFTLGGTKVSQLAQGSQGPEGRKLGVSTVGWVAIGVGVLAVAAVAAFVIAMEHCPEHADEC